MLESRWIRWLLAGSLITACAAAHALGLRGALVTHDPSAILQEGEVFYSFSTGQGINGKTSTNLIDWADSPNPVFSQYPAWIYSKIKGFSGGFWAPDLITMGGYHYIYYSVSTFGSSTSAIGVARSASLAQPVWQDLGPVVESFGGLDELNAIDPSLFRDDDGRVYMTYGSYFGGIGIAEIDQATGKRSTAVTKLIGGKFADMEAPAITRHGPYYYLFVNRGACCKGAASTYSIQVMRSTSIRGPYTEARTLLPVVDGKYRGPGHLGFFKRNGCRLASIHYYDLTDNGTPKLDLLQMSFAGGWPQLSRNVDVEACRTTPTVEDGVYRLVARHSNQVLDVPFCVGTAGTSTQQWGWVGSQCQRWNIVGDGAGNVTIIGQHNRQALEVCSAQPGAQVRQAVFTGSRCQTWRVEAVGGGDVRIINSSSGQVLEVWAASMSAGMPVVQDAWTGRPSQLWRLEPVSRDTAPTGTFRFTPLHSGQALDLQNCLPQAGAPIGQWPWNNLPCQKWTIQPTAAGHFQIVSTASGHRLQVTDGGLTNGTGVSQGPPSADGRQDWDFEAMGNGFFKVINVRSRRVLEIGQCSGTPGARAQQWEALASPCQFWKLDPVVVR